MPPAPGETGGSPGGAGGQSAIASGSAEPGGALEDQVPKPVAGSSKSIHAAVGRRLGAASGALG